MYFLKKKKKVFGLLCNDYDQQLRCYNLEQNGFKCVVVSIFLWVVLSGKQTTNSNFCINSTLKHIYLNLWLWKKKFNLKE